jgi:hypothetical protein
MPLVKPLISQPLVGLVVVQVNPPGEEVTTYSVTTDPPLSVGAVKVIVALPGEVVVAVTPVGTAGTVAGVIAIVAVDVSDVKAPLLALTVNVTAVPFVNPFTVQLSGFGKVGVITHVWPVEAVTV